MPAIAVGVVEGLWHAARLPEETMERGVDGIPQAEQDARLGQTERDLPKDVRRVPARVHRALERGLSLRRDERWPNMEALIRELQPAPT